MLEKTVPGELTEEEKRRMLRVLDEFSLRPPTRSQKELEEELREIRRARRHGGRATRVEG